MTNKGFTGAQKQYLEGLASGLRALRRKGGGSLGAGASAGREGAAPPSGPEDVLWAAQERALSAGQRLSPEEKAKRRLPPSGVYARIAQLARKGRAPEGDETFLLKFHGLFYAAPLEEAFMCRLRFAGGRVPAYQLRGVAELAERHARPVLQLTTRSNLQLRGIAPRAALDVLEGLMDLGIVTRGVGGDGVRNVSASPTAGFDRRELLDVSVYARKAHHSILSTPALASLPRKLTLAFDGGGAVSAWAETCDLGFRAVTVPDGARVAPGVYFRLLLGGAPSHARQGRDAGVVVAPEQALDVLEQVLHLYVEHGDRTNRRRARLAYLLESWGMTRFLAELQARLAALWGKAPSDVLPALPLESCVSPAPPEPAAHIGFHNQKPRGKSYVGLVLPRAQLSAAQARGLADLAEQHGSGEVRLTPQQNLILPGMTDTQLHRAKEVLDKLSLRWQASPIRSGLVACTGSSGCPLAADDTKQRGEELTELLEARFAFDQPLSIHISGCHHGCAQHLIADIGLLASRDPLGQREAERYQLWLGGHAASVPRFGREFASDVPASEIPRVVFEVVETYLERRRPDESFRDFVGRIAPGERRRGMSLRESLQATEAGNGLWEGRG